MDDVHFRVWSADNIIPKRKPEEPSSKVEYICPYELSDSEKTTLLVNRFVSLADRRRRLLRLTCLLQDVDQAGNSHRQLARCAQRHAISQKEGAVHEPD